MTVFREHAKHGGSWGVVGCLDSVRGEGGGDSGG